MSHANEFYINGAWLAPLPGSSSLAVENPATEQVVETIAMGTAVDVDRAVSAARAAFPGYAQWSVDERIALFEKMIAAYAERAEQMALAISTEMGAPISFASAAQAGCGQGHLMTTLAALKEFAFSRNVGRAEVVREPIGVCGFITPWNWPINQIACKVSPALAAGCTMVLKPSEIAPLSALVWAEVMDAAGVPAGVFNLVNGDGINVGAALASHPDVDMVSFTGSTRGGVAVAKSAADTVKRVAQELGGKSPNLIFADADLPVAAKQAVFAMMENTGQSCNAPSRLLVEQSVYDEVVELLAAAVEKVQVGDPAKEGRHIGPLSSRMQFDKVQGLIQTGIDEGARLLAGGTGRPDGLAQGYYCKPTIFVDANNQMTIAREEIFGPVLVVIPFADEAEAIALANDTPYGLAAYLQSGDPERQRRVARALRAGMVRINGAGHDFTSPFGGYKQSGNGREWGKYGLEDFLETKAISGLN